MTPPKGNIFYMDFEYGETPPKNYIKRKIVGTVFEYAGKLFLILNIKGELFTFLTGENKIISRDYTEIIWDSIISHTNKNTIL